jgi:uncharacterized membrane protein
MIGFLVGAAAVAGFLIIRRHHRHHYAMAGCGDSWHGGWHGAAGHGRDWPGPGHRHGHPQGWRRGWGRRGVEYWLLGELDCSPAQEKLIREELRSLVELVRGMRDERVETREDMARAIAGRELDRAALMEMFTRHDKRLVELRAAITASLERVHAALDERQRARLAELVRGGLGGRWVGGTGGGPYRV